MSAPWVFGGALPAGVSGVVITLRLSALGSTCFLPFSGMSRGVYQGVIVAVKRVGGMLLAGRVRRMCTGPTPRRGTARRMLARACCETRLPHRSCS